MGGAAAGFTSAIAMALSGSQSSPTTSPRWKFAAVRVVSALLLRRDSEERPRYLGGRSHAERCPNLRIQNSESKTPNIIIVVDRIYVCCDEGHCLHRLSSWKTRPWKRYHCAIRSRPNSQPGYAQATKSHINQPLSMHSVPRTVFHPSYVVVRRREVLS